MELFLDSSKIEEVRKWKSVISGVTTNPSIILKDGGNCKAYLRELCLSVPNMPVSIEATGDIVSDARFYTNAYGNAVIKVPLLRPDQGDNLNLISGLVKDGIKVNCTALFSLSQVILASKVGSTYVSLFAGRIDDEGGDSFEVIKDCIDYLGWVNRLCDIRKDLKTQLIVGSIRSVKDVQNACKAGAHIITVPPVVLEKMLEHKYSRETVKQFETDARKLST